jgi:hypothetical protein
MAGLSLGVGDPAALRDRTGKCCRAKQPLRPLANSDCACRDPGARRTQGAGVRRHGYYSHLRTAPETLVGCRLGLVGERPALSSDNSTGPRSAASDSVLAFLRGCFGGLLAQGRLPDASDLSEVRNVAAD